jgi:transcription elongation factor SPT5
VIEGELQGAMGTIQKIENDQVIFKPTNLDGFVDNLGIDHSFCVKYFEQGDLIRLIDGKYKGETGMVTAIEVIKGSDDGYPIVKLDMS